MTRFGAPLLALLFVSAGSYAQSAAKPEFEAASIKPSPPPSDRPMMFGCHGGPGTNDPALFICENHTLFDLVTLAFRLPFYQVSAPDWASMTRFDLRAIVPEGATKEQFSLMLQNFLADRFRLAVHRETREIQRYELKVARGGPKFKQAAAAAPKDDGPAPSPSFPPELDKNGCPVVSTRGGGMFTPGKARLHYPQMSMEFLTAQLSAQMQGPVTDLTGLSGKYDIDLCWSPGTGIRAAAPGADPIALPSEPSGPTLQQALQDQLGLRLESKKGPVDFIVVDHAEKVPTEN